MPKPPIFLLHAFPLDSRIWTDLIRTLAIDREIITPDLRGFGSAYAQLDGLPEITMDQAAADLVQFLDERGVAQAVVGGISRGGYIALAFARHYPERLSALMLFDTRATPAEEAERQSWTQMAARLDSEGIAFLPEVMRPRLFGKSALSRPDLLERVDHIILSQHPDAVAAAARGMATRPDQRPILAQINVPTLALAGTEDAAFENTKAIAAAIPGARFIAIPDAGHLPILEAPDQVANAMREWLRPIE